MGIVYLTGAGPGDIELLTIKALNVVKKADVIIYDRLANPDILKETKDGCSFVYVGKEDGKHTLPQDEINEVIYQNALKHEIVVRLKGGDPFVFGRGGEEGEYLSDRGIKFEIIPGITSAVSAPAYAGIPVTHRGISASFKVVTGHEAPNKKGSQVNWEMLKGDETIVFLMGYHNLSKICSNLLSIGKPEDYPVAVISKGTLQEQKVVITTLRDATKDAKGLQTPVMIVVGKVVSLREKLKWFR